MNSDKVKWGAFIILLAIAAIIWIRNVNSDLLRKLANENDRKKVAVVVTILVISPKPNPNKMIFLTRLTSPFDL